ncbi:MAG TPA: non-homologous end-joining DNA ligase [Candidatus Babeliales bacterium]|nr:non-homologous end-joining DNA ligase [Candidatus Babeliales bacterium]
MSIKAGRYVVEISHPEKILFAPTKITKGDLINYYFDIADYMIPYMKDHPLTMVRYPNGIKHDGFYQKDSPEYFPQWIKRVSVKKQEGGVTHYVVCNNQATLIYLANQNCITPHLWLSKYDKLENPDRMIFDIDPSIKDFQVVKEAAWIVKKELDRLGLKSFVMTTGAHGLHVTVPLNRRATFDEVKEFARAIAEKIAEDNPKTITTELNIKKRGRRTFIDYLRNGFGATAVAPYAVRPIAGAPVATPLSWQELDKIKSAQQFTIKNIFKRLDSIKDPWKDFFKVRQSIKK